MTAFFPPTLPHSNPCRPTHSVYAQLCSFQVPAQPVRAPHVAVIRAELYCAVPQPSASCHPFPISHSRSGKRPLKFISPNPQQTPSGQAALDCVQLGFEALQGPSRQCVPGSEHSPHSKQSDFLWTLTCLCAHCLLSGLGTTGTTTGSVPKRELLLPVPGKGFQMERSRAFRAVT